MPIEILWHKIYAKDISKCIKNMLIMSQQIKFKTSINCQNCINLVRSHIDGIPNIEQWKVDTTSPDKILTIEGKSVDKQQVISKVQEAGFQIEAI